MKVNKIETYTCDVCGKTYNDKAAALKCEEECKRQKNLKLEQDARLTKIQAAFKQLADDIVSYTNDYNEYPVLSATVNLPDSFTIDKQEPEYKNKRSSHYYNFNDFLDHFMF